MTYRSNLIYKVKLQWTQLLIHTKIPQNIEDHRSKKAQESLASRKRNKKQRPRTKVRKTKIIKRTLFVTVLPWEISAPKNCLIKSSKVFLCSNRSMKAYWSSWDTQMRLVRAWKNKVHCCKQCAKFRNDLSWDPKASRLSNSWNYSSMKDRTCLSLDWSSTMTQARFATLKRTSLRHGTWSKYLKHTPDTSENKKCSSSTQSF